MRYRHEDRESRLLGSRPMGPGPSAPPRDGGFAIKQDRPRGYGLNVAAVQQLQRVAGNAAVARLLVQRVEPDQNSDPWRMTDRTYAEHTAVGDIGDTDLLDGTKAICGHHKFNQSDLAGVHPGEPYKIASLANGRGIFKRSFTSELWYKPPNLLGRALGAIGNREVGQSVGDVVGGGVEMVSDAVTGVVADGADYLASGASAVFAGVGKAWIKGSTRAEFKKHPEASAGFYAPDQFHIGQRKGFLALYIYLYGDGKGGLVYPRIAYHLSAGDRSAFGTVYDGLVERAGTSSDSITGVLKQEVIYAPNWDKDIGRVKNWTGS